MVAGTTYSLYNVHTEIRTRRLAEKSPQFPVTIVTGLYSCTRPIAGHNSLSRLRSLRSATTILSINIHYPLLLLVFLNEEIVTYLSLIR